MQKRYKKAEFDPGPACPKCGETRCLKMRRSQRRWHCLNPECLAIIGYRGINSADELAHLQQRHHIIRVGSKHYVWVATGKRLTTEKTYFSAMNRAYKSRLCGEPTNA